MIDRDRARMIVAVSATMSHDPIERTIAVLYLATGEAEKRRQDWWRWSCWLALGITVARIEAARRG